MNPLALLIIMVLSVILGFIWYGPLFGKKWMALSGIVMEGKPTFMMMAKPVLYSLVGALFLGYALSFSIVYYNSYYVTKAYGPACIIALILWIGFIVPVYLNLSGWEKKPWTLFFINSGYWLVFILISAAIIVAV